MPELKNKKHEMFCLEYLKDLNAHRAYRDTYPSAKKESAAASGTRLVSNVKVAERIKELYEERRDRVQDDGDSVLDMLRRAKNFNLVELLNDQGEIDIRALKKAPIEIQRLLSTVKLTTGRDGSFVVNMDFISKQFALDKLGSHEGLWKNNHNLKVKGWEDLLDEYLED